MTPLQVGILNFDRPDARIKVVSTGCFKVKSFRMNEVGHNRCNYHVGQNQVGQNSTRRGTLGIMTDLNRRKA